MKKYLLVIGFMLAGIGWSYGQISEFKKTVLNVYTNSWYERPNNIMFGSLNPSFDFYYMQPFRVTKQIAFSVGAGLTLQNNHLSSIYPVLIKKEGMDFYSFDTIDTKSYLFTKNKIFSTKVGIPFELRYKAPNSNLRFAIGGKVEYNLAANHRYVGDDFLNSSTDDIEWRNSFENINKWQYGLTARVGFGLVNLFFYYPMNSMFKEGYGENLRYYSLGISIMVY